MKDALQKIREAYLAALQEVYEPFRSGANPAPDEIPYLLEQATISRLKRDTHWFISGISGSGKTTITSILQERGFARLANVTTRARRDNESEDDYVFTDEETFRTWERDGLLFHPHTTNGSSHAIRVSDLERLTTGELLFADKSIASVLVLHEEIPAVREVNFVYLLAPTFDSLYERIMLREKSRPLGTALSEEAILKRFEEEILDMRRSTKLPYVYLVNDTPDRISAVISSAL